MIQAPSPLYFPRLWLSVGCFILLAIVVLSLIAIDQSMIAFKAIDKVEHLLAWGVVMFWFVSLYPQRALVLFGILFTLSLGIELAQALTTWRHGSAYDLLANFIGLLLGWALALLNRRRLLLWLDRNMQDWL